MSQGFQPWAQTRERLRRLFRTISARTTLAGTVTSAVSIISLPAVRSCCEERGRRRKLQTYSSRPESPDHHRGRASSALRPQLLHEPALFPAPFFFRCFPNPPCLDEACRDKASRLRCHS